MTGRCQTDVRQIVFKMTDSKIEEKQTMRDRPVCMGTDWKVQTGRQTVRMIDRYVYEWTDRQLCSDREGVQTEWDTHSQTDR